MLDINEKRFLFVAWACLSRQWVRTKMKRGKHIGVYFDQGIKWNTMVSFHIIWTPDTKTMHTLVCLPSTLVMCLSVTLYAFLRNELHMATYPSLSRSFSLSHSLFLFRFSIFSFSSVGIMQFINSHRMSGSWQRGKRTHHWKNEEVIADICSNKCRIRRLFTPLLFYFPLLMSAHPSLSLTLSLTLFSFLTVVRSFPIVRLMILFDFVTHGTIYIGTTHFSRSLIAFDIYSI